MRANQIRMVSGDSNETQTGASTAGNDGASCTIEKGEDPSTLLIMFGGLQSSMGVGIPPMEFVKTTAYLQHHRMFIRDLDQMWYHSGLRGHTTNLPETVNFLQRNVLELAPKRVICIGNSAGAWAALYFGHALRADAVHALCPQTYIGAGKRCLNLDVRWFRQIYQLHRKGFKYRVFDLNGILGQSNGHTAYFIHVGTHRLDYSHALNLQGNPGVHISQYPCPTHELSRMIRSTGYLSDLLALDQPEAVERLRQRIIASIENGTFRKSCRLPLGKKTYLLAAGRWECFRAGWRNLIRKQVPPHQRGVALGSD